MGAERAHDGLSPDPETTRFQRPDNLEAAVDPDGRIVFRAATEQHRDSLTDWSQGIGAVDLMDDRMIATIDRHHLASLDEIQDLDQALEETAVAAGARQLVIARAEQPFNHAEIVGLRSCGFQRPPTDRVTHLHPHRMVKDLSS